MSLLGGLNPANIITQAPLALATGGTSLIAQSALQIGANIAKQALQTVGQQLGLPQHIIDGAQGVVDLASGNPIGAAGEFLHSASGAADFAADIVDRFGGSPSDIGNAQRQVDDAVQQLVDRVNKSMRDGDNQEGGGVRGARGRRGGEGFLMALARVMGRVIDGKMDEMLKTAKSLDQAQSSGDKSHISEMSAKIQALGQEVSMLSTALNASIKSVGEASTTLARKS